MVSVPYSRDVLKQYLLILIPLLALLLLTAVAHYYSMSQSFLYRYLPLYASMALLLIVGSLFLAWGRVRRRTAASQREYERRFRSTLETVELAAVTLTPAGQVTFCNDFLLNRTGYSRDQVTGKNWFDTFIPREDRTRERERFAQIISTGSVSGTHKNVLHTCNGDRRLLDWNYTLSMDADGRVIDVTGIGQDITEQHHTEEELRKLSRAVEQSPSTVMIADTKGRIEYVNPKFTELTGYTLDDVRGESPSILKSGEMNSAEYESMWETISAGHEWRGVFHNRKKNGELYWEAAYISGIRDAQGKITHYVAVKEDITERKQLEQQVKERNLEIAKNQALAATGQMATMIAHDLRNPLSSIKMGLQILGKKPAQAWGEEEQELKQIALRQVGYMEEILEDLLSYSRPDALKPDWVSLDKVLDTSVLLAQKQIKEHQVRVRTRYQTGLPTIHGDAGKLRQAFSNIIVNAVQATEDLTDEKGEITISTRLELADDRPRIRIAICDNGCGVQPEQKDRMFEPFFTTRTKGTGLGLAIVKRIIDQHHGTVCLRPGEYGGACAIVILPTGPVDGDAMKQSHDTEDNAAESVNS